MPMARKSLSAILSATLIWLSVAGGLLAASAIGMRTAGHWQHHAQFMSQRQSHAHAHHAAHDMPLATASTQQSERDCAAVCLDTVAAKLLPAYVVVKAPDLAFVSLAFEASGLSVSPPVPVALAYWTAAPPDSGAIASTGAARVLARHSHLQI